MNSHFLNRAVILISAFNVLIAAASARTFELTDLDADRIAGIGAQAPLSGWVMTELGPGEFSTIFLDLVPERAFLIRYPLDRIPEGQRITRAEWVLPVQVVSPTNLRLQIRRVVGPWGKGVCHQYRMQRPNKVPWTMPGAAGLSTDRATQPTAVAKISSPGEVLINVTEDVELWYTGAAENQGWIVTMDDVGGIVRLASPFWSSQGGLRLRITYEPE